MHGLFQKLFKLKTSSSETSHTKPTLRSSNSLGPAPAPSSRKNPSTPPLQSALKSPQRWSRKYDVFVCHSSVESDVEAAMGLVSFLEGSPRGLRCFLWVRDAEPGGAVASEVCRAVQDSHMRAMLISPAFLQDGWCKYMMHQALAEGPMSGRTIPLLSGISFTECPQELRYYFNITLGSDAEHGYATLNNAVLRYLQGLMKQEQTLDLIVHSSHCGLSQPGGPGDEQGSPKDSSETLISTEVISSTEDVVDAAITLPAAEVQDSWL